MKTLNEAKQVDEQTSWWIRGDGSEDIQKKQLPSITHPLYLVNDVEHAYQYAVKHSGKSLMTVYELDLNKSNVGAKIFDLTSPDDLKELGYSSLLAKVFSEVDAYFSWSMNSSFSEDRVWRPRELDFAYKFLLWKNGKANQTYANSKAGVKGKPKAALYHLIESKSTKFENASENDLKNQEFLDEYLRPRFSGIDLKEVRIGIVNAYIDTFKTLHDKWDKNARKVQRDKDVPVYVDSMLVVLMQDIRDKGYDGYFCPELKSRETGGSNDGLAYVSTAVAQGAKKVDTIAVFAADAVKQVFQCDAYDFDLFAAAMPDKQRATKNSLKAVIGLIQEHTALVKYASERWRSRNPLGPGFPVQAREALLDAANNRDKCLWHVWTDAGELSKINRFRDIFPHLDIIIAAPASMTDADELLKQRIMQDILADGKLTGVESQQHMRDKYTAWKDRALRFEKIERQTT